MSVKNLQWLLGFPTVNPNKSIKAFHNPANFDVRFLRRLITF